MGIFAKEVVRVGFGGAGDDGQDRLLRHVAAAAGLLRAADFASVGRVLVYGTASEHQARVFAQCPSMPRPRGKAPAGPPSQSGVYWCSPEDHQWPPRESYDAAVVVGALVAGSGIGSFEEHSRLGVLEGLRRVLRPGGLLAGVVCFGSSHDVPRFRLMTDALGLSTQVSVDLSLEGPVWASWTNSGSAAPASPAPQHLVRWLAVAAPVSDLGGLARGADPLGRLVVTGVSLGLPNSLEAGRPLFDPRNVDRVLAGENFIAQLTDRDKRSILEQNVVQMVKVDGKRVRRSLERTEEVVQVASRLGAFDLAAEFGVPAHVCEAMDVTYRLAVAAGLVALRNAGVVLGAGGDGSAAAADSDPNFALPPSMRDETGVIFASSFPCTESTVEEVTRSVRARTEAEVLGRAGAESAGALPPRQYEHEFDRKLLLRLLVMANSQLAELIGARGPNTHINSACSGASQALAVAEDWIRVGRCRRVVVVSADNVTSEALLPYIGTGFLALTAATVAPTVAEAAVPFDRRRSGMILGMGATGIVLEALTAARERGARPRAELVASHFMNSAFHASLLDRVHISSELARFVGRLERDHGLERQALASDLLYFSHETCTWASGGCAKAEVDALAHAFGEAGKERVQICNTKGFTGHPMAVAVEDVLAVSSLERGVAPPIANFAVPDPVLGRLHLSTGGAHARRYALRFSAGFGSQFVFLLFRKWDEVAENMPPQPQPHSHPNPHAPAAASASEVSLSGGSAGLADEKKEGDESFRLVGLPASSHSNATAAGAAAVAAGLGESTSPSSSSRWLRASGREAVSRASEVARRAALAGRELLASVGEDVDADVREACSLM